MKFRNYFTGQYQSVPKNCLLYIAHAYSTPRRRGWSDEDIQKLRYDIAAAYVVTMVHEGYLIYAPIISWHDLARIYTLPKDQKYWAKLEHLMLCNSKYLVIIPLYRNESFRSDGVQREIETFTFGGKFKLNVVVLCPNEN